jgi:uncharacterized BrkB/YihY/UPF0761 family membrane protein
MLWTLGKAVFKYFILHVARLITFLGVYGVFIAFLFWLYYSVFVLVVCAELQSVLLIRAEKQEAFDLRKDRSLGESTSTSE